MPNDAKKDEDSLASDIDPPQNNILVIEGVDRIGNETEERLSSSLFASFGTTASSTP